MDAFSSSERSPTISQTSSKLLNAKRKPPAVKNPLPPRHASGAFSTTSVLAPASRAESAAHMAALPPPTTITSYDVAIWTPSGRSCRARLCGGVLRCQATGGRAQPRAARAISISTARLSSALVTSRGNATRALHRR